MKGQLVSIVLISVIISFMPLSHATGRFYDAPKTITVPDDYPSIQAAINASNPGDTVLVRNGTYHELVVVNKTITLAGESRQSTIIDANGSGPLDVALYVYTVSNATIENLTIENSRSAVGALGVYPDTNYTKIRNVSLQNNLHNLWIGFPNMLQNTTLNMDESNTVDGKPIYFWVNRENEQVPSDAGYIALIDCTNVTVQGTALTKDGMTLVNLKDCLIKNVSVTNTESPLWAFGIENCTIQNSLFNKSSSYFQYSAGLELDNFSDSSFTNNTVTNMQGDGVHQSGSFSTISENTIYNNTNYGLYVAGDNNLIGANSISNNTQGGIQLQYCKENNVSNNQIVGNMFYQIELDNSSFNWISRNAIIGNISGTPPSYEKGIALFSGSDNNTIVENSIYGNYYGIQVMQSNNNSIFHNNFIDNTNGAWSILGSNIWDNGYPSGGNYWSDYVGPDKNHDGIGDTFYAIPNAYYDVDNYPLMKPYVVPEFSYIMIIPLFALTTLAILAFKKNKRKKA